MRAAVIAGFFYCLVVMAIGIALGSVRVLLLEPRVGTVPAVLIEMPVILALSWLACAWAVRRWQVAARPFARIVMGVTAFILLQLAEMLFASVFFALPPFGYLRELADPDRMLGLAGQAVFAAFPYLQYRFGRGTRT